MTEIQRGDDRSQRLRFAPGLDFDLVDQSPLVLAAVRRHFRHHLAAAMPAGNARFVIAPVPPPVAPNVMQPVLGQPPIAALLPRSVSE